MNVLTIEELWKGFLKKDPPMTVLTRETERHGYAIVQGVLVYLTLFRQCPTRAITEVAACALIFIFMFGALYLKEILCWIEGMLK